MRHAMIQFLQIVKELLGARLRRLRFALHASVALLISGIQSGELWLGCTFFLNTIGHKSTKQSVRRSIIQITTTPSQCWRSFTRKTACGLTSSAASSSSARTAGRIDDTTALIQFSNFDAIVRVGKYNSSELDQQRERCTTGKFVNLLRNEFYLCIGIRDPRAFPCCTCNVQSLG